jgi:hypothetical protein
LDPDGFTIVALAFGVPDDAAVEAAVPGEDNCDSSTVILRLAEDVDALVGKLFNKDYLILLKGIRGSLAIGIQELSSAMLP